MLEAEAEGGEPEISVERGKKEEAGTETEGKKAEEPEKEKERREEEVASSEHHRLPAELQRGACFFLRCWLRRYLPPDGMIHKPKTSRKSTVMRAVAPHSNSPS